MLLIPLEAFISVKARPPTGMRNTAAGGVIVLIGTELNFYCLEGQGPKVWKIDDRIIAEGLHLRIVLVNMNHSGVYRCLNKRTGKDSEQKRVDVTKGTEDVHSKYAQFETSILAPEMKAVSSRVKAVKGQYATLGCSSNPFTTVRWFWEKNASSLSNLKGFTSERIKDRSLHFLHISNVTLDHEATYQCEGRAFGRSSVARVHMEVIVPPKIIDKPLNIKSTVGKDVQFSCKAKGKPEPQLTWHKYSEKKNIIQEGGVLRLENVGKNDEGTYVCSATNYNGVYVTASAQLLIEGAFSFVKILSIYALLF